MCVCYYKVPGSLHEIRDETLETIDFSKAVIEIKTAVEKLLYLTVLHRIMTDSAKRAIRYRLKDHAFYWKANKHIIDYTNSVYFIKEYLVHYSQDGHKSDVYAPFQGTYEAEGSMLKFICEYRNYLTHYSFLEFYYEANSGEIVLDIDNFVEYEQDQYSRKKSKERKEFLDWLINQQNQSDTILGIHFYRMVYVVNDANDELQTVLNETYKILFHRYVQKALDSLISLIHKEGDQYYDTYYEEEEQLLLNPNLYLEGIVTSVIMNVSTDSPLTELLTDYLKGKGYTTILSKGATLEATINELKRGRKQRSSKKGNE